jgi:hypothetical protein
MKTIPVIRRADEGDVSPSPVSSPKGEGKKKSLYPVGRGKKGEGVRGFRGATPELVRQRI